MTMKALRPLILVASSTALLVLLPAWAVGPDARPTTVNPAGSPAAPPPEVQKTGIVTAWQIKDDGTVCFRLEGDSAEMADDDAPEAKVKKAAAAAANKQQNEPKTFRLWFVTPPSQTTTKQFEFMVLHAAINLHRSNFAAGESGSAVPKVTVHSTPTEKLQGKSPEDAMPVDWIAQF